MILRCMKTLLAALVAEYLGKAAKELDLFALGIVAAKISQNLHITPNYPPIAGIL